MIIGFDMFDNGCFTGNIFHNDENKSQLYTSLEICNGLIDEIFVNDDPHYKEGDFRPEGWDYYTNLHATLDHTLEGGSIEAGDLAIKKIRIQKRNMVDLVWEDVADLEYIPGDYTLYEYKDKFIRNQEIYQYSLTPMTDTVKGKRIESNSVQSDFEDVFISGRDNTNSLVNYKLRYNLTYGQIDSNLSNNVFTPRNSKYPIVVTGNLDYSSFSTSALLVSANSEKADNGFVDIREERVQREQIMNFLKNGKPKVYRDINGMLKLVMVVGNPAEEPNEFIRGLSKISMNFVEIGDMDYTTLKANGLLDVIGEERGL